jgi:hypothetical protein
MNRYLKAALSAGMVLVLAAVAAWPQAGSTASVTVKTGPEAGKYDASPSDACVLVAFGKKPLGLSAVFSGTDSSLSVDMPNIDQKHANEIQVVLVISHRKSAGGMKNGVASITYEIDTRPDAALDASKRAERANKGLTGKATTQLMERGSNVLLSFSGETASGVKLEGEVNCRKVESEAGAAP